jgi:DNA invertase Pin-like site-specific DNA recombinase
MQGDIKHLVVAKLDRLGRSAIDLLNTVKLLDSLKVILHIVDLGGDSLSTQGASGRLIFTVLAGMAEYERALIAGRIEA